MTTPLDIPAALAAPSRSTLLLLESRIPARLSWVGTTGEPYVAPMWFEWSENELLLSTFAQAKKVADLETGTSVMVTIDTETFPYRSVRIRGTVNLERTDGLTDSYRRCATRYLGPTLGQTWCEELGDAAQVLIRVHPIWASASDMAAGSFLGSAEE